jgi:hypothetical protein
MRRDRRQFFRAGGMALGAVTTGSINAVGSDETASTDLGRRVNGFGWEITNINNNGANVYFEIQNAMRLHSLDVDVAFMITSLPSAPGFAEVLCTGGVFRDTTPIFVDGPQQYVGWQGAPGFGTFQISNPNGLNAFGGGGGENFQLAILKTWVPADGTGSATWRNVSIELGLSLNPGDYLVFHMDHAGVPGDVEMQGTLGYSIGLPLPRVVSR